MRRKGSPGTTPICGAVNLYRVPFVHIGSEPWAEDQMQFISRVKPDHREAK
jgi:hypothetical protein